KASLNEVGTSASVSVIYPPDHLTDPNKTIATGLTDSNGNFTINPDISFSPANGDIFALEGRKRLGGAESRVLSVKTFIQWNGSGWNSMTSPNLFINTKTTALSIIADQQEIPSADTIGTIDVSGETSVPGDVGDPVAVTGAEVLDLAEKVTIVLNADYDPFAHITYQFGSYLLNYPGAVNANDISGVAR